MNQLLLIPDPRPLVERLGAEFFREAPQSPGVYLMRGAGEEVLYVGKAKNLRNRLRNYRVANPDRMRRRHLRLLREAVRIELQECADESAALARESALLRELRPRYNRAGTWPGVPRYLLWRVAQSTVEFSIRTALDRDWHSYGPTGAGAVALRAVLVRLLWCALYPERGLRGLPAGWFNGRHAEVAAIRCPGTSESELSDLRAHLSELFSGRPQPFAEWIRGRIAADAHPFEAATRATDLEALDELTRVRARAAQTVGSLLSA